jgi:hypothetical protein
MHDDIHEIHHKTTKINPPETNVTAFKTPEEIASHDNQPSQDFITMANQPPLTNKPTKKFWPPTKKQKIIGIIAIVVLSLGIGIWYLASNHKATTTATVVAVKQHRQSKTVVKPTTVPSTLSGLPVAPSVNKRPITAVIIENTPYARPQAGLSQAGVVFEALTEGGITRFLAFYQDQLPNNVGPIRSARPYFLTWDLGFDAPLAHVGGSPKALAEIPQLGVKNLDYMYYPGFYHRISSRPAPHNVYTSLTNLINLESSKGWTSSNYTGWPRKPDSPAANPNATTINFNLSYSTYNVSYSYNKSTDSYARSEGGAPQIDANTNQQLSPKVVIGMIVPWSQGPLDTSNAYYSVYQNVGSGQAYVFQDGTLTIGQWNKPSAQSPLTFTTTNGQPLKLNAGQTWITALGSNSEITYN